MQASCGLALAAGLCTGSASTTAAGGGSGLFDRRPQPPALKRGLAQKIAAYQQWNHDPSQHPHGRRGAASSHDSRAAAWHQRAQRATEERRRQRRQHERQQWEAAAAAAAQAAQETVGSREQQARGRWQAAEDQQQQRQRWAQSRPGGSSGGAGAGVHWGSYSKQQWQRYYDVPVDEDDYWGKKPSGGQASASAYSSQDGGGTQQQQQQDFGQQDYSQYAQYSQYGQPGGSGNAAGSQYAYWQDFVREAASGFHYQQAYAGGASTSGNGTSNGSAGISSASLEQQARAEVEALLVQCGGDLLRLVAALGIPFELAADRRASLRNARTAALLRLHPDKLQQHSPRQQALGAAATQLVNELWRQSSRP